VCKVLTSAEQANIYWQAQSAWYVTLICSQFWHIWFCKTRAVSLAAASACVAACAGLLTA
jgi:hypothetical protein